MVMFDLISLQVKHQQLCRPDFCNGNEQLLQWYWHIPLHAACQMYCFMIQYGEDAIKEGMGSGGGGGGMGDIFDILSGGGRRSQPRERRGENVVHRLKVSLEEMYSGGVRKLSLSRNIKCDTCGGSGTKSGKRYQCDVSLMAFLRHMQSCVATL